MHSRRNTTLAFIALFGATFFSAVQALSQTKPIVIPYTTSTQHSRLFAYLRPISNQIASQEEVIAKAEQALDTGRRGDADVVFVHANRQKKFWLRTNVKRYP
jgi:tungstate transport system substrate-binding protein